MFHINAPGQEDGAASLPADYEYPSMEQLAEQVQEVLNKLSIVKYIGIGELVTIPGSLVTRKSEYVSNVMMMSGVGLGANVLTRHALAYPERVEAMMLVNTCTTKAGWVEWGCQVVLVSYWSILYSPLITLLSLVRRGTSPT